MKVDIKKMKRESTDSWIGKLNIVRMPILPNSTFRSSAIPIKIPASDFVHINKMIINCVCKGRRHRIANIILKKNDIGLLTLPDFKIYSKAVKL